MGLHIVKGENPEQFKLISSYKVFESNFIDFENLYHLYKINKIKLIKAKKSVFFICLQTRCPVAHTNLHIHRYASKTQRIKLFTSLIHVLSVLYQQASFQA